MSIADPEIYQELRLLAKRFMSRERKGHTLSPTDLFHEAFTRLTPVLDDSSTQVESLHGLFALSMRRVLIDHARKRARRLRKLARVSLQVPNLAEDRREAEESDRADTLLAIDHLLTQLAVKYPLHARIVELKFFAGLTVEQCAEELGICKARTQRSWNFARAWIGRELRRCALE